MAGSPVRALTSVRAMRRAWSSSLDRPDGDEQQRTAGVSERHGRRRVRQWRPMLLSGSLNRIPKSFCVFANPSVPCHDHDQRRRLVNHLRCRQVHGVERTNRLDRERSADASENRVRDTDQVTAKLETTERAHRRPLFVGRQPRGCARSKNRPCGFGNRQCGSDLPPWSTDRFQCVRITLEKRGDQRGGLDVPNTSGFRGRGGHFGSTLRRDRRQSARRQFPPEGRYPATLLSGHRLRVAGVSRQRRRARRSGWACSSPLHLAGQAQRPRGHEP